MWNVERFFKLLIDRGLRPHINSEPILILIHHQVRMSTSSANDA